MARHSDEFEDTEENKLSYTPIFNEYVRPPSTASYESCALLICRQKWSSA